MEKLKRWARTLTGKVTLQMSCRIALVMMIAAFLSYYHVIKATESSFLNDLKTYVQERGISESKIFHELEAKHLEVREETLARLHSADREKAQEWFQSYYPRHPDGTRRLVSSEFEGRVDERGRRIEGLTGMVGRATADDPESAVEMAIFYDLLRDYGPSLETYLPNIYFHTPTGNFTIYWPGFPAAQTIEADTDMSELEWVRIAMMENNPERESVWTGLYFDPLVDSWMLSIETPVYSRDEHLVTIGQDILLTDILRRTSNQSLPGTYNIVFSSDGDLVAHPDLELPKEAAAPSIARSEDGLNGHIFEASQDFGGDDLCIIETHEDVYFAITKISGPDWFFVTVYPKKLVRGIALDVAGFVFLLGVVSLLAEIILLYFVFRKNITLPLFSLMEGVRRIQSGQVFKQEHVSQRSDEFGALGRTIEQMNAVILSRERNLKQAQIELQESNQELEKRVSLRTQELAKSNSNLRSKALQVKVAHDEAIRANESKSRFLANMSHELRTPLNAILGMAQCLETEDLTADQKDQVDTILKAGKSLVGVVSDILDLSKVEAAKMDIDPRPRDLHEEMEELYKLWRPMANKKGLDFKLDIAADVPHYLWFDPLRVKQCVSNLLSNAISFTNNGYVSMKVSSSSSGSESYLISIAVSDSGVGISSEMLKQLFNPFEQADSSSTRNHSGTGLGLAIGRELSRLMGGDITVSSEEGIGTSFTFTFVANSGGGAQGALLPSQSLEKPSNVLLGTRILLVDDQFSNRKVIKALLRGTGAEITELESGSAALETLEAQSFDLLLLDMNMPEMDGPTTMKIIRESGQSWASIPTIALTADAMQGDRERYLSMRMDEYISKPVDRDVLTSTILKLSQS